MKYLLLAFLFFATVAKGATEIVLLATNLSMPTGWSYSTSDDSPEGAWVADLVTYTSLSATVTLSSALSPGNYNVIPKILDYDHGHTFGFRLGGVSGNNQILNDRDVDTIYWGTNVSMNVASTTSQLIFTITRASVGSPRLFAIYISSDTNSIVRRDDRILTFKYPTAGEANNAAAIPGNLVPNSSFEAGIGPFWRITTAGRVESLADLWSTNSWHGTRSMRLPVDAAQTLYSIESLPITLASNKSHALTVYVKSRTGACRANLRISSLYTAPVNASNVYTTVVSTVIGTSWTRLSVIATNIPYYPSGEYYITLLARSEGGVADEVYFDGLQLEEGVVTNAYAPMHPFEFDIAVTEPTQVIWTNNTSTTLDIRAFNNTASTVTKRVDYSVYNWTNGVAFSGSTNVTASGSNVTVSLTLPLTQYGHFRSAFSITNQKSDTELTWIVMPPPASTNFDTNSFFGSHMNADTNVLKRNQRIGVKWQRSLSFGRFRWSEVERTSNSPPVYTWPNLSIYTNFGMTILGNLGEDTPSLNDNPATPSWINPITDNTNMWFARFVTNAAINYTNIIWNWEVWNEPDQDTVEVPTLNHYAVLARQAALALKSINPRHQVIIGGGVQTYIQVTNIWALMGTMTNLVDGMSVHEYPGSESAAVSIRQNFSAVPVMNTESGAGDKGSYTFSRQPFRRAGSYAIEWKAGDVFYDTFIIASEQMSKNFITCIGNGLRQQFYYDGGQRNITVTDFDQRQFTWIDYDDSIRAKGAAVAGFMRLIDKATNTTSLSVSSSIVTAYGMVRSGTPYVGIWTSGSNATAVLNGSVSAGALTIFDLMGNGSTPASLTINISRTPVLISFSGNHADLFHAVSNAVYSVRADTQAPQLLLVERPRVVRADTPMTFRWFAVDDQDTPSEALVDGITYRYRKDGGAWSDWVGDTWVNYYGLSSIPLFDVQARDRSGNIASAGSGALATFSITNPLPVTQMVQVVRFTIATNDYDPATTILTDANGTEVPYQRGSSNQIFFRAGLLPNSTQTWSLVGSSIPTSVSGQYGYLGLSTNLTATSPYLFQVTNGMHTGFRIVNPTVSGFSNAAPIQGFQNRNGHWVNGMSGTNGTNFLYVSNGEDGVPPILVCWSNMTVTVIDAGPIRTELLFEGTYRRLEFNYLGSIEQWADSPGFYKFRVAMDAGEPVVQTEPYNNDPGYWRTDFSPAVTANQYRYRGHSATSTNNGYLWGFGTLYNDAPYSFDLLCNVTLGATNLSSKQRDELGNTAGFASAAYNYSLFIRDAGMWNLLCASNGAAATPTVGWANIRQSVGLGGVVSANSPRLGYWSTNTGQWGLEFGTQPYATTTTPMALQNARGAFMIYFGTNGSIINSSNQPGYIQPEIMPLWARHYALDIDKIKRWDLGWVNNMTPGAFYMAKATVSTNYSDVIKAGGAPATALYNELKASGSSETDLIADLWLTNAPSAATSILQRLVYTAEQSFNMMTNWLTGDAQQASRFNSLQGGQILGRAAPVLDAILADGNATATVSNQIKAWAALFGNFVRDNDFTPIDNYPSNAVNLGTQNMGPQYVSFRGTYSMGFTNHPVFGTNAFYDYLASSNTLTTIINDYGATIGSPHYAGASVQPIYANLLQARVRGWTNSLYGRLQNHADWNIQSSTPIDPRFGQSELVVFGNGYPSANGFNGMLAGGFYDGVDNALASKLLYRWQQEDRPTSDYFFPSFLMTPRNYATTAYTLRSSKTQGYWTTHRARSDTTNHTGFWLINGSYYSDHRIAPDTGNYNWFPLGVPGSVQWGSIYYPEIESQLFGNIPTFFPTFPSWNGSNVYTEALTWTEPQGEQTNFIAFSRSTWSDAHYTNTASVWARNARTFDYFQNMALLELQDTKNNSSNYIATYMLMSTGVVVHPTGSATPVFITNDVSGAINMPLVAAISGNVDIPLAAGTNLWKYIGVPWVAALSNGNDFMLMTHSPTTNQATLATWSHSFADTTVLSDYLTVNGATRYFEQQQIQRIKGTNNPHALQVAYRKGTTDPSITTNGIGGWTVRQGNEIQNIYTNHTEYSRSNNQANALAVWSGTNAVTATNGLVIAGGPTEIVIEGTNSVDLSLSGQTGLRVVTLPSYATNRFRQLRPVGSGRNAVMTAR